MGAATAKQPPAKSASPPPSLLQPQNFLVWSFSGATAASRGPSPVPEPTPTPIGKMCVFQVSKYCHLPESSMASPLSGGVRRLRIAPACFATGVHVASHSNRSIGWVRGILHAQLESANQTYLYSSSAFSQTGETISSFHFLSLLIFYNKWMTWRPYQTPHTKLWLFICNSQSKTLT